MCITESCSSNISWKPGCTSYPVNPNIGVDKSGGGCSGGLAPAPELAVQRKVFVTACLSGAAKLARRKRGEKKCDPREKIRAPRSAVPARHERGGCFCLFFLLFLYNTYVY